MSKPDRAQQLLDAHVEFVVAQLQGAAFSEWLGTTLSATREDLAKLKFKDTVPQKAVEATALDLAGTLVLDDSVREMVCAVVRTVWDSDAHDAATLGDLLDDDLFAEGRDKAIAMRELREGVVHALLQSDAYQRFVADLLYHGIRGWATNNPITDSVPGAKRALALGRSVLNRARPGLDDSLDKQLRDYIDKSIHATADIGERYALGVSDTELARGADAVWKRLRRVKVADIGDGIEADDAADWADIVYRGLTDVRATAWCQQLLTEGVAAFYAHYGDYSLAALLDAFGVTDEVIARELRRYTEPAVKQLKKKKMLDAVVRRQLEGFYQSKAARAILTD